MATCPDSTFLVTDLCLQVSKEISLELGSQVPRGLWGILPPDLLPWTFLGLFVCLRQSHYVTGPVLELTK